MLVRQALLARLEREKADARVRLMFANLSREDRAALVERRLAAQELVHEAAQLHQTQTLDDLSHTRSTLVESILELQRDARRRRQQEQQAARARLVYDPGGG